MIKKIKSPQLKKCPTVTVKASIFHSTKMHYDHWLIPGLILNSLKK